ncbi:MAG: T9SS type A sorting domain-containing protein [Bacteroidales bacterium]|nr:T9SS type A sorting domain-containing protein [Bacteroidales bacterium]
MLQILNYDFDSDGKPDAWLDTASIYPKGYILEEDSVYWSNPWSYLKTGNIDEHIFEDIDHDGKRALDTDNDGIVDIEEPGDKMRVWKITWNINTVAGYEYYEPYCYYELWLDPPKPVELAAGVAYSQDSLHTAFNGMFYPNTHDINDANQADTTWTYWMERDDNGKIIWKELVLQSLNNYEGYTFVDTASTNFRLQPSDKVIGRAPQPHNEFIAVVSLGGEEIDMNHWIPKKSLYSNVDYKTIFNEEKTTPIRTTYTYYAPLPNPLQFEYLTDCFSIFDTLGNKLESLPHRGKAELQFDINASTEYTYYWIRGVGHDVDYNDPSELAEGAENEAMGDGVFGYFVYEIPKGLGGYSITLPKNEDGSYNINEIVQVNGKNFEKWLDNPNTSNEVQVWDGPMSYKIYIPQILIPPALDDDNNDGIDDWIDDRGDRFSSKTGFLHDAFMFDNGEAWLDYPAETHYDNLQGNVDSGWYFGADKTFGDDVFETLGKTHFTIKALFEGKGREGNLELSKGGTLVVEEIFGGSPWVISSHVLSGKAEGSDLELTSSVQPTIVKVGIDTVFIKHKLIDKNEPHRFNINFDPYHESIGATDANFTTLVGTKDPCNLLEPAIALPAIIDLKKDVHTLTLIPGADTLNSSELSNFPKSVSGSFVEIRVEVSNGSNDNWEDVQITPSLQNNLGSTKIELQYVAYPRPLVPNDNFGSFSTGWRFNQPEGEVVVQLGNQIPTIQPTRRAYFIFLLKLDNSLENGIYTVDFTVSGKKVYYTGTQNGDLSYSVPSAKICIAEKHANGMVKDFEKIILGQTILKNIEVSTLPAFTSLGESKWSIADISPVDYKNLKDTLTVSRKDGKETINLASIGAFPTKNYSEIYILQPGIVDSYNATEATLKLTNGQILNYETYDGKDSILESDALSVTPIGPKVKISHTIYSINGKLVTEGIEYESDKPIYASTLLTVQNTGADISRNTVVEILTGAYFDVIKDSLPENTTVQGKTIQINIGDLIQGEEKQMYLYYILSTTIPKSVDITVLVNQSDIEYTGTVIDQNFKFASKNQIIASLYDFEIQEISYTQIADNKVLVSAKAFNKGIDAENVWFRIYPIFGGGAHEFAIVEEKIADWKAGEVISIETEYTLPGVDKSLEMIAKIDDQYNTIETTEKNNSEKTGFILTSLSENSNLTEVKVNPNPCNEYVEFIYNLESNYDAIEIIITNAQGVIVKEFEKCPASKGANKLSWFNINLPSGVYFYHLSSEYQLIKSDTFIKK